MSNPRKTGKQPAAPAQTARQEGAQGGPGKTSASPISDGAVDSSDPKIAEGAAEVADQVHANA